MRPTPPSLYEALRTRQQHGRTALAVLLDPDNLNETSLLHLLKLSAVHPVDYFFVGGSLVLSSYQAALIALIKDHSDVPVLLFPSHSLHLDGPADGVLLLSLISGRNPDFLIGQHVVAASRLKASGLQLLSTGYMLVDSGRQTTASYMSGTTPMPHDKPGIAACTALAGEQLGLKLMYLDGGSGAPNPVSTAMIAAVRETVSTPIIVGGGLNSGEKVYAALAAGADVVVVGNHIEAHPEFLGEVASVVASFNKTTVPQPSSY